MADRGFYVRNKPESTTRVQEEDKIGTLDAGEGGGTQGGCPEEISRGKRAIVGLSPDDAHDGTQTIVGYRFDLLPMGALFAAAEVMQEGVKKGYDPEGWKDLTTNELLNHAIGHIIGHLNGDRQEDHLSHAIVRVMMAWQTHMETGE